MVNTNNVVSVTKIDLLTLYGTIMKLAGTSFGVVAGDGNGNFAPTMSGSAGNKLANAPVKTFDFVSGVTAAVVYFVADYAYTGFKVAGTAVTTSGATVDPDAVTLYTATLADGGVTIAAVTPVLS